MGHRGMRTLAAYGATKGAISALTRGLAVEYAPFGIRVNALAPGFIETALTERVLRIEAFSKALLEQTPLRRFGTSEDVANAALFFASRRERLHHRRRARHRRRHGKPRFSRSSAGDGFGDELVDDADRARHRRWRRPPAASRSAPPAGRRWCRRSRCSARAAPRARSRARAASSAMRSSSSSISEANGTSLPLPKSNSVSRTP